MFDEMEADPYSADYPASSDVFSDFFSAARDRVVSVLPAPESSALQSQLMSAIYSFGAGAIDQGRDKLVGAFLKTGEGRKVQASATKQTLAQYLPFIVVGVVVLAFFGFFVGRR